MACKRIGLTAILLYLFLFVIQSTSKDCYDNAVYRAKFAEKGRILELLYATIDLGSNTIRLTIYRVKDDNFNILFTKKATAGIVGYVKEGQLTQPGIDMACAVLEEFCTIAKNMDMEQIRIFATASLRNIQNTQEAVAEIQQRVGQTVEVLSGEEEATLDFVGAIHNIKIENGILVDIGGGSTELATYQDGQLLQPASISIGSLNLYNRYVEKILPKSKEWKAIEKASLSELKALSHIQHTQYKTICGVGGTVRAALKLNNYLFSLPPTHNRIETDHLKYIVKMLKDKDATAKSLILKICPDRVHTIIPGLILLRQITKYYDSEEIIVSNYGVREGFFITRILQQGVKDGKENKTD